MPDDLPRLLADFPRVAGVIKDDYEDFQVTEIPLYPADGAGTHTYFLVEKAGLTTMQAARDVARALNVRQHEIGFAGQKDARAVTRQLMSVEHVDPQRVAELKIPRLRILETTRHRNKLRLGHLKGNRFTIKVRDADSTRLADLREALARLAHAGVPNYFGPQRFGYRGDTWIIGRAILRHDLEAALHLVLGRPTPADHGRARAAREAYDRGDFEAALRAWPSLFHSERRALKALLRDPRKPQRAFHAIDRSTRGFYVSAYQSYLFNRVVTARVPHGLDRLWNGDLAFRHPAGGVFRVDDAEHEQPRADAFEISPTGPLFGYRMGEPDGPAAELEDRVLTDEGLIREVFRSGGLRVKGDRRPLRFQPADADIKLGADPGGPYLELQFALSSGCYATTLLRELFDLHSAGGTAIRNGDASAPESP